MSDGHRSASQLIDAKIAELGDSPEASGERGSDTQAPGPSDVEAGMAEMSKRFHDQGGELYVPAAE